MRRYTAAALALVFVFFPHPARSAEAKHKQIHLPFTCADLASPDVQNLSASGAHSYLGAKADHLGIPALYYAQFSDWSPGGPLLGPAFEIDVLDADGQPVPPAVLSYQWRPDRAELSCRYGQALQGSQVSGYANSSSIVCGVKLRSLSDTPVTLRIQGSLSAKLSHASAEALPTENGFRLDAHTDLQNPWGQKPAPLAKSWILATSAHGLGCHVDGRSYSATFSLAPHQTLDLRMALVPAETSPDVTKKLLENPGAALERTTKSVDAWLAQVKKPRLSDPHRVSMYYNAWYQFWYNTEHPEGLWTHSIITPSKSSYGRGVWLWDSGFHIFALLQGGKGALQLAKDQLDVLCNGAKLVGHIPREVWMGAANPELQPPGILTWAAMDIYQRDHDRAFLKRVYPVFAANDRWFYAHTDANHDGLCEWMGADSGWDTSPRWDKGIVDAVDLNCWLKLDQDKLAAMAEALGKPAQAAAWRARSEKTRDLIRQKMWDEQAGCFYDLLATNGQMVRVKTPATFWTLFTGVATANQAARMVGLLGDPKVFGTKYPMPCVGVSEPTFDANNYWRGPTWVNLNWLTILGLERYRYHELAGDLRRRTLDMIAMNPVPREYYNAQTGAGLGAQNYMWTGALYIVMSNEKP